MSSHILCALRSADVTSRTDTELPFLDEIWAPQLSNDIESIDTRDYIISTEREVVGAACVLGNSRQYQLMAAYKNGAEGASLAIRVFIFVAGAWWYLYWILVPTHAGNVWLDEINSHIQWKFIGARVSTFLFQAVPVFAIALLSFIVIELKRRRLRTTESRRSEKPKVNVWTLPMVLRSPLGILTLADFIFIFLTTFVVSYYLIVSIVDSSRVIDTSPTSSEGPPKWQQKLERAGLRFGLAAMIPFALLWIPVSRGSPILRVIGLPFERAVKYHTWLGVLTISLLLVHGACFITFFSLIHQTDALLKWHKEDVSVLPGWIALAAGFMMLVAALGRVRRKYFDVFFTMHHLYLAFLVFFAFHAPKLWCFYIVPVLLFFLDRFMRMVQSGRKADVLSARILPSGAMELKFARPSGVEYHPLSFLYVLFPSVSRYQWHPFSIASSSVGDGSQMSIYIKPLGAYTKNIQSLISKSSASRNMGNHACPFSFKISVEGPYGDESNFYMKYQTLILVAGGIGVTPLLAIIRDILHRHRLQQEDIPTDIQLIYCVRNPKEMSILDTLDLDELCPNYAERLNIIFRPYVTSRIKPLNYEADGREESNSSSYEEFSYINWNEPTAEILGKPMSEAKPISEIHAFGHSGWVATTVFSTLVGFFVLWGIFNMTIIHNGFPGYYKVLLLFACVFLAVTVFGGGVMLLWALRSTMKSPMRDNKVTSRASRHNSPAMEMVVIASPNQGTGSNSKSRGAGGQAWVSHVSLGRRPEWRDVFEEIVKQYEGQNVGVLVSGVSKMQEDVACECKYHSLSKDSNVVLHYHSVSFEL